MKRVGVLGASFNPPTLGHKNVILQSLEIFDLVILVPSLKHPFNKKLVSSIHRVAMLKRCIDALPEVYRAKTMLMNVEAMLLASSQRQYIYTFDVLQKLQRYFEIIGEPVALRFIMGPDNAQNSVWKKFYKHAEIDKRWPPFVVKENIKVHSEQARTLIKTLKHKPNELKKALMPFLEESIIHYILQNNLYVE
ncbi:MAG: adenylyltransferase/cytidyltransferase family protein [Candidatus Berkiella sp.]